MKLFFILGNQLFPTKYIDRFKKDHTFFMAEDSASLAKFLITEDSSWVTGQIIAVEAIQGYQESLKKNKGSIVLFSTVAAQRGFANHAIIASTKAAVEGLTVSLAAEFAPSIRVNCIAPSLTNSKISNFLLKNEKVAEGIAKMHPMKRIGEGGDSASVAKFLLTEESSWITGQIIGVDGGRSSVA